MPGLKIGISSCLAGNPVRYDGDNKRDRGLLEQLLLYAELVPMCPEVAIGMGTPRPPIQLTESLVSPRAKQVDNPSHDFTQPLTSFALQTAQSVELHGFVFKARSPSCGYRTTPVFIHGHLSSGTVSGIFARTLLDLLPGLPACDETIGQRPADLEEFVEQCMEYRKENDIFRC